MSTKNYLINDKWLDIDKQNIIELQSVDGELITAKCNGEDIGGGGGGSSDFTTAEVTINHTAADWLFYVSQIVESGDDVFLYPLLEIYSDDPTEITITVALYKGHSALMSESGWDTVSIVGNATEETGRIDITGDCVITIS